MSAESSSLVDCGFDTPLKERSGLLNHRSLSAYTLAAHAPSPVLGEGWGEGFFVVHALLP